MTIALLINAILGLTLFVVIATLLAASIRRGHVDRGHAISVLRRQMREHHRPVGVARHHAPRPQARWTARPDAS